MVSRHYLETDCMNRRASLEELDSWRTAPPAALPALLSGATIVVRLLEQQGVRMIAGIPGGPILPLYDALAQSRCITHVLARHEQGAGFIAQGWARATGEAGVCIASSGPGATNLITAIADAKLDSIPLIAITAQVPRALLGTDAFQEVDTLGISMPVTKHNFLVSDTAALLDIIPRAFRIALSGRPGPVLIDIPKDVLTDKIEVTRWPLPGTRDPAPGVDDDAVAAAAHMIDAAERPVLYVGGGVIHSGAAGIATALAEKAGLPTTMTLMALGTVAADHPLSLGMLGMHAARFTNFALEECDLLIAAGARFDDRATGRVATFCPRARVIHIDIDPAELNKLKAANLAIAGDVKTVLQALLPRIRTNLRETWRARIGELKRRFPLNMPGADDARTHYGLIRAVAASVPADAIITTDVGQHQMWAAQAYPLRHPRQWLTSGGLGTMGFGLPAAIGAALAHPGRSVVCLTGDGSVLMNIQELATAVECGVNIKIVVMNNYSLGLVHQQQSMFYGRRIFACRYARQPDFMVLAQAFGLRVMNLDCEADPRAALAGELAMPGAALIHASIDVNENVYPMVPPGAANCEMIEDKRVHAHDSSAPAGRQAGVAAT
jgi:acetolactate synthase-1/2/3 large subunit